MEGRSLTIQDLLNPFGPGSMAISLKTITASLTERFYKSINSDLTVEMIRVKDSYIFHAKVPSESNGDYAKKLFYDVILEFYPNSKDDYISETLSGYGVRVFSNAMSFTFAFTYVFRKKHGLVSFLPSRFYSKKALKEKPVSRNPTDLTAIEKTIWFTLYYMMHNSLLQKNRTAMIENKTLKINTLIAKIATQDEKIDEEFERKKTKNKKHEVKRSVEPTSRKDEKKKKINPSLKSDLKKPLKSSLKSPPSQSLKRSMMNDKMKKKKA